MRGADPKSILVTGGAGYIGSHIVVALAAAGYLPVIVDDLSNSYADVVVALRRITGVEIPFYEQDIRDQLALAQVFSAHEMAGVIHLAARKAVGESVSNPLEYYQVNIGGLLSVAGVMRQHGVRKCVYSSSATVYAPSKPGGLYHEDDKLGPINPYGWTKFMGEQVLTDLHHAGQIDAVLLRYFNPVGAHESGLIGENPRGRPNNLMPLVAQVACGIQPCVTIHGNDYPTPDGTAIRDYVHVMDVAEAHVAALDYSPGTLKDLSINIGTGEGHSVRDVIDVYEHVNNTQVATTIGPRRVGDAAHVCADTARAQSLLQWRSRRTLDDMCRDLHRAVCELTKVEGKMS